MRVLLGLVLCACALAAAGAAAARKPLPAQTAALKAIDRLAARGGLDAATAAADRATVDRTAALLRHVPKRRAALLAAQLHEAAEIAPKLTAPRAAAIFGQLAANDDWLASKAPPRTKTDITDADGVVYRYFPGRGFEFHPLANFAALNAAVAARDTDATQRLAAALTERGVPLSSGGTAWEYYFDYAGGKAPWLSGMAQAVAAQAFARASALLGDDSALLGEARAAYRTIPGRLDRASGAGTWIRLYSFNKAVVLNAQLQTILSLQTYAGATGDRGAAGLSAELQRAAADSLGRFDTGYWSYYSLPHTPSPLDYHDYVVQLLRKLAPADPRFAAAAARFASYETQPPAFKLADGGPGAVRFWISKPAAVTVAALGDTRRLSLVGGWQQLSWKLPRRPGLWQVTLTARDSAGNSAQVQALPIVHVAAAPPAKKADVRQATAPDAAEEAAVGQPSFLAGVGLDSPAQAKLAQREGFGAVRIGVVWPAGATAPDPATLATFQGMPAGQRLVLELVANPLPVDDAGRDALAAYAEALVQQLPDVRDLLLGPPPAPATAADYAAAFTAVETAVKSIAPTIAVGGELDGAAAPRSTLAALAAAAALPPDELAFSPAPARAKNAWTLADYAALESALSSTFPGATVPVLEDSISDPTLVPASKAGLYAQPLPTTGDSEAGQATAYTGELAAASCRPNVIGVLLRRLVDGPAPGEQGGLLYPDGTPKASLPTVRSSVLAAGRGTAAICPGLAVPAATSALAFPATLVLGSAPSVQLGCVRDCLYLLTLERARDGKPVLARRGSLRGGAPAATVRLPHVAFAAGSYRLTVRVVNQTNPGPIAVQSSPVLAAAAG
jgi:hypothetical protein